VTRRNESPEPFDLTSAFAAQEQQLAATLGVGNALTSHGPLVGAGTEEGWADMLRRILPGRYGLTSGKVVDSQGHQSQQIDLIVYDAFYSPLLFTIANATFVPAESVYAVFEVKQTLNKAHLDASAAKAASVRRLHRTSALIPNHFGLETRKDIETWPILGGILASGSDWGVPFEETLKTHLRNQVPDETIDFGCGLGAGAFDTVRESIRDGRALVSLSVSLPDRSLSYFMMRLLHRLQRLGTVGAIDYEAYAAPLEAD
jgi:hypothetical protein